VICPTCEYEFDPVGGLQCPRCGERISCSGAVCARCDGCASPVERLRRTVADRLHRDGANDDGDPDHDERGE
jgi:predicted amidophosphoribosyltransferase